VANGSVPARAAARRVDQDGLWLKIVGSVAGAKNRSRHAIVALATQ
jgi:hypothetical protein